MAPCREMVRNFNGEDLSQISRLYEHFPSGLEFIRDKDFLLYYLNYPGVTKDSIFIAKKDNEISGLAIISIMTEEYGLRQGNIIEFRANDSFSTQILIQKALDYCNAIGVDVVTFVPPPSFLEYDFLKDWLKYEPGVMMGKLLNAISLFQVLLLQNEVSKKVISSIKDKIIFSIGDEVIQIDATSNEIKIENLADENYLVYEHTKHVPNVTISPNNFIKIIFGQLNPYLAYLSKKMKIQGTRNILGVLKLLSLMKIDTPIYVSMGDRI